MNSSDEQREQAKNNNRHKELQDLCDEALHSSWIRKRMGDKGSNVSYLEANYIIRALNKVFPLGWSRIAKGHSIIFEGKTTKGQHLVHAECEMTLILHPGGEKLCEHTDIGMGKSFASDLGVARASAIKNAFTDALKRCATVLGDFFGLGLKLNEDAAGALGVIHKSKRLSVFEDEKEEVKSSKRFPWLDGAIYEELVNFYQEFGDEVRIETALRNRLVDHARSVYNQTFFLNETNDVVFETLAKVGVLKNGRALPTFGQVKEFLSLWSSELGGETEVEDEGKKKDKPFSGTGIGYRIESVVKTGEDAFKLKLSVPDYETTVVEEVVGDEVKDLLSKVHFKTNSAFNIYIDKMTDDEVMESMFDIFCNNPEELVDAFGAANFGIEGGKTVVTKWASLAQHVEAASS